MSNRITIDAGRGVLITAGLSDAVKTTMGSRVTVEPVEVEVTGISYMRMGPTQAIIFAAAVDALARLAMQQNGGAA